MSRARATLAGWLRRLAERLDPTPPPATPAERKWVMLGGSGEEEELPVTGMVATSELPTQEFWYTTTTGVD